MMLCNDKHTRANLVLLAFYWRGYFKRDCKREIGGAMTCRKFLYYCQFVAKKFDGGIEDMI